MNLFKLLKRRGKEPDGELVEPSDEEEYLEEEEEEEQESAAVSGEKEDGSEPSEGEPQGPAKEASSEAAGPSTKPAPAKEDDDLMALFEEETYEELMPEFIMNELQDIQASDLAKECSLARKALVYRN